MFQVYKFIEPFPSLGACESLSKAHTIQRTKIGNWMAFTRPKIASQSEQLLLDFQMNYISFKFPLIEI